MESLTKRVIKKIINHLNQPKYYKLCSEAKDRLQVGEFLPKALDIENIISEESEDRHGQNKIFHVAIMHQEVYMYNMIHSIYEEFQKSDNIVCDIIISASKFGAFYKECAESLRKRNIPFRYDFDCTEEVIDVLIAICIHVAPSKYQKMIRDNSHYCVAIPSNEYDPTFMINHKTTLMAWKPDAVFCEKWQAEACQKEFPIPFYASGNPKYDLIYETYKCKKQKFPESFAKLRKSRFKKVFLYITDHNPGNDLVSPYVSFDLYAKLIFSFFENNRDVCLIFRPYTPYIDQQIDSGIWTKEDLMKIKNYCSEQENIIWDEEDHDSISISFADAIICDVSTGIATHALPVMKPIGIPLRWDMNCNRLIGNKKLKEKCYYYIRSLKEMQCFIQMVLDEENPKSEGMRYLYEKAITHFDGKIANRIKGKIMKEYYCR